MVDDSESAAEAKFESLCNKVASLVYSRTDGVQKLLGQLLDALNALDYSSFHLKKEKGVLLINQCCYLIPSDKISLSLKAVHLFINLILKGFVAVEGKTLSLAIDWCLKCLKNGNHIIILKCLQALAKGNGKKIEEQNNLIIPEIIKLSNNFVFTTKSKEICLNCLRYIEAATIMEPESKEVLATETIQQYFEIFKNVLLNGKINVIQNDLILFKYLITAIRGISNLILMSDWLVTNFLSEILGIVKGYMLYGLLGDENYEIQKLFPTSTTIPEILNSFAQSTKKIRGKYDKKSKKVIVTSLNSLEEIGYMENQYTELIEKDYYSESESSNLIFQTSESDFSDNEHSQNMKIKSYETKLRHCALILLETTVEKTNPRAFIGYMPSFLPDNSNFLHMRTLITCLMQDPSPKCRAEAVKVILIIISNSRQYFLQADGMSKSSFTAFSCTISNILKELHKCLLMIMKTEKNLTTLKYILKCFSDLIRCTPYHKVDANLLTDIGKNTKFFLEHKDINVQILALTIFGCIISVEPKCKEVTSVIFDESHYVNSKLNLESNEMAVKIEDFDVDEEKYELTKEKPWLFSLCIGHLIEKSKSNDSTTNVALQIESLQVIGALSRNFFKETVISFPEEIIALLKHCSNKEEYSIKLYTGKLMETILNSLQFNLFSEDDSKKASISLAVHFWEDLLQGPIISFIQSQEPMLRCTGCDCLANMGIQTLSASNTSIHSSLIYDQLSRKNQILCVTLMFNCLQDESPAVRSSAARALAIFVLFPSLRNDSLFLLDVVDATIKTSKDKENSVRTQASWLFGNLSEAIFINKETKADDDIEETLFLHLLETGIKLSNASPKAKPGAVRGIGNLLRIIENDFLKKNKDVVVESIETLIKNATTGTFMKGRWNSCYAIANALQNPLICTNNEWMPKIFNIMISLVQHYKNFKVRTSAGLVLGVPPNRQSYGNFYCNVWSAALNALENSKNISDFNEYQHRDQLVDQICMVLCHLVSLIEPEDLSSLQDILYFHLDNLSPFMTRFQERIVPEKSNVLLSATERITYLFNKKGLTVEEKNLLRILQQLFT